MAGPSLRSGWRWLCARPALLVFVAALIFAATIDRDVPWTDDARFYVPAATAYGQWLADVGSGFGHLDFTPLGRAARDRAFQVNHEHPPVGKYAMALGWLLFHRFAGLTDEVTACRTGVWALWAWMIALCFAALRRYRGTAAGAFGALALVLMPRVLFHGQVETLDLPVTSLVFAAGLATFAALESPSWRRVLGTALLFGLALGCKLNAPFLLIAVILYWLIVSPPRAEAAGLRLPALPAVLVAMVLFSPLVAWTTWPWLWSDALVRLNDYLSFHLHHYGILFYFRGTLYSEQVAPWTTALTMTALTVPLPVLALAVAGGLSGLHAAALQLFAIVRRSAPHSRLECRAPHLRLGVFALLAAAVQLAAVSLPGVPVYGGVKLFLPAFPFVALLAGLAFAEITDELGRVRLTPSRRAMLTAGLTVWLLLPGALGIFAYRGTWLSYYNELAGGLRGATAAGFERQYYDLAYPELPTKLAELLPNGGAIAVLPNPKEYAPYLERWRALGRLPATVRLAPVEQADLLLLTHERRWRDYPLLLSRYRTRPIVATRERHDVPLYTIFALEGQSPRQTR